MKRLLLEVRAFSLRLVSLFALGLALFLLGWPILLYREGHWVQTEVDLACFLLVMSGLAAALCGAAGAGWRAARRLGARLDRPRDGLASGPIEKDGSARLARDPILR